MPSTLQSGAWRVSPACHNRSASTIDSGLFMHLLRTISNRLIDDAAGRRPDNLRKSPVPELIPSRFY